MRRYLCNQWTFEYETLMQPWGKQPHALRPPPRWSVHNCLQKKPKGG